ncbi:MAG: hypothetical protein HY851_05405 [candidate division Zixibacteria bacterium]|nr:hypothetical protein [candidate division Zixibacteria bacterium]
MASAEYKVFRYSRCAKVLGAFLLPVGVAASVLSLWFGASENGGAWYVLAGGLLLAITILGIVSFLRFSLTVGPESIVKRTLIIQTMRYADLTKIIVQPIDISLFAGWKSLRITQETEGRDTILALLAERIAHRTNVMILGDEELIRKHFGEHQVPK